VLALAGPLCSWHHRPTGGSRRQPKHRFSRNRSRVGVIAHNGPLRMARRSAWSRRIEGPRSAAKHNLAGKLRNSHRRRRATTTGPLDQDGAPMHQAPVNRGAALFAVVVWAGSQRECPPSRLRPSQTAPARLCADNTRRARSTLPPHIEAPPGYRPSRSSPAGSSSPLRDPTIVDTRRSRTPRCARAN